MEKANLKRYLLNEAVTIMALAAAKVVIPESGQRHIKLSLHKPRNKSSNFHNAKWISCQKVLSKMSDNFGKSALRDDTLCRGLPEWYFFYSTEERRRLKKKPVGSMECKRGVKKNASRVQRCRGAPHPLFISRRSAYDYRIHACGE